ncbi:MAG: periplasmic heavy metal sensor [Pseudomonadota bacterium]
MLRILFALIWASHAALAQDHSQPYAGFEARSIKGLSPADIAELERGGGWGLALPAELNGRPGPAHVLELQEALGLTAAQVQAITVIHDDMRSAAIAAGARLIAAEAALSDAFAGPQLDAATLQRLVEDAAAARGALRLVHLSRHLDTPAVLTPAQIARYAVLRGYADDPCAAVPDGHDPTMWRRHNGCD